MSLTNPSVLLITGASRGIGAACALLAASQGFNICVNYADNQAAALDIVSQVKALGRQALAVQADVGCEADILRLFKTIDDQMGALAGLVNNAGILETRMRVQDMSLQRLQRVMNVNVIGSILCAREAVNRMSTEKGGQGGSIVNLSSAASRLGSPNEFVDYAASKGAIDSLTIGLAKEVAMPGIRVNGVRPGLIHTDIHISAGAPDRVQQLQSAVPMQRGGTAQEVAQTIVWLLSKQASYVTGALVDVAGGR